METLWEGSPLCEPNRAYPKVYVEDVCDYKAATFRLAEKTWPGCNIDHFIYNFLQSSLQERIDIGHAHWIEMLPGDIFRDFCDTGYQPVYTRSSLCGPMVTWAAWVYAAFQWHAKVYSTELVQWLPPYAVATLYNPWHTQEISRLLQELPYGTPLNFGPPTWADPSTYPPKE